MRPTFRAKLLAIVAVNAFALLVLVVASSLIERRVADQLDSIQARYVPRIGLRPRLEGSLERVERTLQDAAAAGDADLLVEARRQQEAMLAQLAATGDAVSASARATLRIAVEEYFVAAAGVSRRLIDGETGEDAVAAMEEMQARRATVLRRLDEATSFDEDALAAAFTSATDAQQTGARIRLIVGLLCLVAVVGLSIWIGRSLFQSLGGLASGLRRFGDGDFATPIPIASRDELGDVAQQANQMASRLDTLGRDRDRHDRLHGGHAALVEHVHGEQEPEVVATRAATFLAGHLGAPAAAIYYGAAGGELIMLGHHGLEIDTTLPPLRFGRGQGLVGQAARGTDLVVIRAPDDDTWRLRTGLVEARPRTLVLVPLLHLDEVTGVLELALLGDWTDEADALLRLVRDSLTVAIEVARTRAATRVLLARTQRQASELLEARTGLERKAEELTRASVYKSRFLASMSHELRTPLNAIIGFSELMHDGKVTDAAHQQEFLGHVLASGRHLLQLINDVLDLSKVEAGKLAFQPEPIVLSRVAEEVVGILRASATTRRIQLHMQIDPSVEELVLDPARLKQVLYNYLSNGIKFTPAGGRVELRAIPEGADAVRLEIEDTGIGIAPEDLERLFGEFQQIGAGRTKPEGTGLGLALTKRLVEAQGGQVGVRSTVGEGSVFHAILPRTMANPGQLATIEIPQALPGTAGAPTVLVIEDDPSDQVELAEALRRAGYAVEVVATGAQALARARAQRFDAITLDLLLPDMSGFEVLRLLRTEGRNQQVPVVIITLASEPGAITGFAVSDVLPKPVDAAILHAALVRAGVSPGAARVVLLVDDDPGALRLLEATLQDLGYQTRSERDGQAALGAVGAAPPHAIVLDLLMPGMSGFEFLDQLRASPDGRDVPVVVWTSMDLSAADHAALRASASAVVSKGHGGTLGVVAELASYLPPRVEGAA